MRVLLVALLVLAALPSLAPSAAACHPTLAYTSPDGQVEVEFDMGCGHELPYYVCVRVAGLDVACRALP